VWVHILRREDLVKVILKKEIKKDEWFIYEYYMDVKIKL